MNTDTSTARLIEAVIDYCAGVWNDDEIIDVLKTLLVGAKTFLSTPVMKILSNSVGRIKRQWTDMTITLHGL